MNNNGKQKEHRQHPEWANFKEEKLLEIQWEHQYQHRETYEEQGFGQENEETQHIQASCLQRAISSAVSAKINSKISRNRVSFSRLEEAYRIIQHQTAANFGNVFKITCSREKLSVQVLRGQKEHIGNLQAQPVIRLRSPFRADLQRDSDVNGSERARLRVFSRDTDAFQCLIVRNLSAGPIRVHVQGKHSQHFRSWGVDKSSRPRNSAVRARSTQRGFHPRLPGVSPAWWERW